jgi:hypothetical protein
MGSSLDELLREIENESSVSTPELRPNSAGLDNLPEYEAEKSSSNSSPFLVPEMIGQVPQLTRDMIGGGAEVSENGISVQGLSARQRALPKISLHMVGSILAVFVLMIGLGSSVLLSQQPQDVRQQAYEGQGVEQTGEVAAPNELNETSQEAARDSVASEMIADSSSSSQAQPFWQQPIFIAGIAIVVSMGLLLVAFLHWLFAA